MVSTPDINEVAIVMSRLQHNYSQLANNWFTIFYDPTPRETVTVTWYDEDGNLDTYTLPNRAYDFNYIQHGSGSPEGTVSASVGTVYQDTTNGDAYLKKTGASGNTGWVKIASISEIEEYIIRRAYNPEGQVTANVATLCENTSTGQLWIKQSGSGSTGWARVSFDQDYVDEQIATRAKTDLSNLTSTGETHFLNKTQISNCILSAANGVCTYSGANIVVKQGVNFLLPNGRNTDGTLKNIEHSVALDRTFTNSVTTVQTGRTGFFTYDNSIESFVSWADGQVYTMDSAPVTPAAGVYAMWFSPSTNTWKYTSNGSDWATTIAVPFCTFDVADTDGNVSNVVGLDVFSIAKSANIINTTITYWG